MPAPHRSRYILRFQIDPERPAGAQGRALATFCAKHAIPGVALMMNAEDQFSGPPSQAQERRWFDCLAEVRRRLVEAGIEVGLNPWTTAGHCDRGRSFPAGRGFAPAMDPRGRAARSVASFACPRWRAWVAGFYAAAARAGFTTLWIEDDFRFHNHEPLEWGGGFEPEVCARLAKRLGLRSIARSALVRNLLKPGPPHAWRAAWIATLGELHREAAAAITEAVHAASPVAQVGLMSSAPDIHAVEGRDWGALFAILAGRRGAVHRPHFVASYAGCLPHQLAHSMQMLDRQRQLRSAEVAVMPEIENFPHTDWTKPDVQTWAEMAIAQAYGADAQFLDLHPFTGVDPSDHPEIGRLLDESRPALDWIAATVRRGLSSKGVGLPWDDQAPARLPLQVGASVANLTVRQTSVGSTLLSAGIPVSAARQPTMLLCGTLATALPDSELDRLLAGGLIVDAEAAQRLLDRGRGRDLGLRRARTLLRDSSAFAMERVIAPLAGVRRGYQMNLNVQPWVLSSELLPGTSELSALVDWNGRRLGSACWSYRNRHGGRIAVLGTMLAPHPAWSRIRQSLWQEAVHRAGARGPMVTGLPHAMPAWFDDGQRQHLMILNGSNDCRPATVRLPGMAGRPRLTHLDPLARPRSGRARACAGGWQTCPIPAFGLAWLTWDLD